MPNFLIAPDSFKGTMSSLEVAQIMADSLRNSCADATVTYLPIADGGEGTVDAFLNTVGGDKVSVACEGPFGIMRVGFYGLLNDGTTAIIEMSSAAGKLLAGDRNSVSLASTYGVGQQILEAAKQGCTKIYMGLGGSCTNDGGCGAAAACGVKFYNEAHERFVPAGGTLVNIASIDKSDMNPLLENVTIVTLCDVDNPLCGITGAANVFAAQKGADSDEIQELDAGLAHLAEIAKRDCGVDMLRLRGAASGGGMGAGMAAFFGSALNMGVETILDLAGFDEALKNTDYVLTGEGCFDMQSLHGKVLKGVAQRAKAQGVPVIAVVGSADESIIPAAKEVGITSVVTINRIGVPLAQAIKQPRANLASTMNQVASYLISGEPLPDRIHL